MEGEKNRKRKKRERGSEREIKREIEDYNITHDAK